MVEVIRRTQNLSFLSFNPDNFPKGSYFEFCEQFYFVTGDWYIDDTNQYSVEVYDYENDIFPVFYEDSLEGYRKIENSNVQFSYI